MLNDRVLPWFEEQDLDLLRILTDRGSEFCGNRERHEYALYLDLENIEHSRTKAKSPQTNGICERFHQTIQNEFYASAFRRKLYTSIEQLQNDVDQWMESYNHERTHSGKYWLFGTFRGKMKRLCELIKTNAGLLRHNSAALRQIKRAKSRPA
jgi:hypothetical protein